MKTYRRHHCHRTHTTPRTMAQCLWPHAEWIAGNAPYALLAHCRVLTITLHTTRESAEDDKAAIDRLACGGACHRDHEIIRLAIAPAGNPAAPAATDR